MSLKSLLSARGKITIPKGTYGSKNKPKNPLQVELKGNNTQVTCEPGAVFHNVLVTISGNKNDWNGGEFVNSQITITGNDNIIHDTLFRDGARGGNKALLNAAICTFGDASNNIIRNNEIRDWQRRALRVRKPTAKTKGNVITGNYLHDFIMEGKANAGEAIQIGENQLTSQWLFAIIWAESKSFHNRLISVFFGCVHFATRMPGAESA